MFGGLGLGFRLGYGLRLGLGLGAVPGFEGLFLCISTRTALFHINAVGHRIHFTYSIHINHYLDRTKIVPLEPEGV